MELFNIEGHLTDEGLNELVLERIDELQRLEAAEHLSFCDECIIKYTERLEGAVLYDNAPEALPRVKQRLRKRLMRIAFSKYATAAASVALALIIGGTGIFSGGMVSMPKGNNKEQQKETIWGITIITDVFSGLFNRAPSVPKIGDVKIPKQSQVVVPDAPKTAKDSKADEKKIQNAQTEENINSAKATALPGKNPAKDIAEKQNMAFDLLKPKAVKSN